VACKFFTAEAGRVGARGVVFFFADEVALVACNPERVEEGNTFALEGICVF
jgi:hypothetical protein